jgi:hypothetical protein
VSGKRLREASKEYSIPHLYAAPQDVGLAPPLVNRASRLLLTIQDWEYAGSWI